MSVKHVKNILASRVRTLRNTKGWTQEHLAEVVDVHATYISRIESALKVPTICTICKLAEAFNVNIYELFVDDENGEIFDDYKRRKLIDIVRESGPRNIDIYSTLVTALHEKYQPKSRRKKKRFKA